MFQMITTDTGARAPLCLCDICHERILDAALALALHLKEESTAENPYPIIHVHKGDCDRKATAKYGQKLGSDELSTHMVWLLHNMNLRKDNIASAMEIAAMTSLL